MRRRLRPLLAISVLALLASTIVVSAPAEARVYDTDRPKITVPGAAFGRGRLWFGDFEVAGAIEWGDGKQNPHLIIGGLLASTDIWGACADLTLRTMSHTGVLDEFGYQHCEEPLTLFVEPVDVFHIFDNTLIQHVEICIQPEGGKRVCVFESRPTLIRNVSIIGNRVG